MKTTFKIAAATLLLASSFEGTANAGSLSEMMEASKAKMACSASCNSEYAQCVAAATDLSLTSSASDILPRTKSNLMAGGECNAAALQCNTSC